MKINIKVCPICKKEDCSGRIYKTPDMYGSYFFHVGIKVICESDEHIYSVNGKYYYKLISGHGDYKDYPLTEIDWEEAKKIIENEKKRESREIKDLEGERKK